MSTAEEDDAAPVLQWRKLTGDASSKGTPWRYLKNNQNNRAARQRARNGEMKISRQDLVNAEAKRRKQSNTMQKKDHITSNDNNNGNKGKLCIVQSKKARYSHLISSQRIMPKQDDDHLPIVYSNSEGGDDRDRKEVAALWLQPFTVLDDY